MLAQEIIRRQRDGSGLDQPQIEDFVTGLVDGGWSDAQVAAMAMAIVLRGLSAQEALWLTQAMTRSGESLHWADACLPGPVLDKHSTGGVGDKVSLVLAPVIAACGGYVPMLSGRGLGHTGGTLDKLESIPGYRTTPDLAGLRTALATAGCAIVGAGAGLAPADRRLYAVRDVTGTVESVPLITASILSKKLAAGLQGLVIDVKVGNGAFAPTLEAARELAETLVRVAAAAGLPTRAWITDMDQVLGDTVGNALEVGEALAFLDGTRREPRLLEVTRRLAAELLVLGGIAADEDSASARIDRALDGGAALERFARMVHALGGPGDLVEHPQRYLLPAPVRRPVLAPVSGWVCAMATREIGLQLIALGGGRRQAHERIDHRVGFSDVAPCGRRVARGDVLAWVHARDEAGASAAASALQRAIHVGAAAPATAPVLRERTAGSDA